MNAYELTKDRADILADELLAYHHKGVCGRAAKMLRKQADRIAELEKPHKYDPETGEPLIDGYPLFSGLPRPQTKPLSDEEIHDIWKSLWEGGNIGHIAYNYARAIEERHGIK